MTPSRDSNLPFEVARLTAWSHRRQLLGRGAADATAALRRVVGVYSAHPAGPLALEARTAGFDAAAFRAFEERREAVRIPGMRGSAFLVPLALADSIVAATRDAAALSVAQLRARGLDEATYRELRPRILEAACEPITPAGLAAALGIEPSDKRPYFAMRMLAREALVLRVGAGSVRTDDLRWVATEAWLGRRLGDVDPADALASLAGAYLDAYGPARAVDFAWWAGVSRRRAEAALASAELVDAGGGYLLPGDAVAVWEASGTHADEVVDVLPKWDPYTMAYAPDGRDRLVQRDHLALAYSTADTRVGATSGDGLPLVLSNGRAVASWSHRLDGRRISVSVAPFDAPAAAGAALVERARPAFERVAEFLGGELELTLHGNAGEA